jgi:Tfp pilus assembly protein PilF
MVGQQLTFENWKIQSASNIRLLPKYGDVDKTEMQKEADENFVRETMKSFETKREASNHMVDLGFNYLYKGDLKTAMYRFNQAYLLDGTNSNIFWGYGAIYMSFREFQLSRDQYDEGLKLDKQNADILIDYGTTYLGEYYSYIESDPRKAKESLDEAIDKLSQAYAMEPSNSNSSFKLSICYLYKDNCSKATEFLEIANNLGNSNISAAYQSELKQKCNPSTMDCTSFKTGKFKINDEETGITLIERTTDFQIEENSKFGYRIKFKITWLSNCTYQLKPIEDLANPDNKKLPSSIVTCSITEKTKNGYIQVSSSDVSPLKISSELIRVE